MTSFWFIHCEGTCAARYLGQMGVGARPWARRRRLSVVRLNGSMRESDHDSEREHAACRMFLLVSSVVALAVFEAFFYFCYVAPRVEMQSVRDSARTVVRYLARDATPGAKNKRPAAATCVVLRAGAALPSDPPVDVQRAQAAARNDNAGCIMATAAILLIFAAIAVYVWKHQLQYRYSMPRAALLDEVGILLLAFAAFDVLFFGALVRHWEATDGPEFLAAMSRGALEGCNVDQKRALPSKAQEKKVAAI